MLSRIALVVVVLLTAACSTPPAVSEPEPAAAAPARVVGYFAGWGTYARDYQVRDIETSGAAERLTHLLYAFGSVNGGKCAVSDPWADHQKPIAAGDSVDGAADAGVLRGNIGQLHKLKAKHTQLKVLWSFGGWNGSKGFTEAARDPAAFAASCHALLTDPRWSGVFDGIDVDWEYPNACGLACNASGRGALTAILAALRTSFGPSAVVTAAVPGDVSKLDKADYAGAARQATWLSAMTYDFSGTEEGPGPTAAHSPLTAYAGIPRPTATADATIRKLLALGVPADKVLLGIGFYGRGWTGVPAATPGSRGTGPAKGTYEQGLEDYRVLAERCPPTGEIGGTAYAFCGDQWWSYDTPATIRAKMAYVRTHALGGAFAWELSGDTPSADLLEAMSSGLA